jgi:hypothetical protein
MADNLKTDAQKVETDLDSAYGDVKHVEATAGGWVQTHTAWAIGLGAFLLGWATRFIHL